VANLARILREILKRIKVALFDPSFNYYLHVSPVNSEKLKSFHWHITIVPKLTQVAGL